MKLTRKLAAVAGSLGTAATTFAAPLDVSPAVTAITENVANIGALGGAALAFVFGIAVIRWLRRVA